MFKHLSVPVARKHSISLGTAGILLAVILSACGQTGTSQVDTPAAPSPLAGGQAQAPGSTKPSGNTRVLTSFAGGTLTHLSAKGTLTFERPMILPVRPAGISALKVDDVTELKPGDVLMSEPTDTAPYGFVRKVENVEGSNGAIVVTTSPATLEDAIKGSDLSAGNYKTTKTIPTDRVIAQSVLGQDGELVAQGLPVFGDEHTEAGFYAIPLPQRGIKSLGSVEGGTGNQCVKVYLTPAPGTVSGKVSANVCFMMKAKATLDLQVGARWDPWGWFDSGPIYIDRFSANIVGDSSGSIDFKVGTNLKFSNAKVELARFEYEPITFLIGALPVVVVPVYVISVSANGTITANTTYSVAANAHAELGAVYTDRGGWAPTTVLTGNFTPKVSVTNRVGLDLTDSFDNTASLLLYGVAGPAFTFSTYATASYAFPIASFPTFPGTPPFRPKGTVVGGVRGYISMDIHPLSRYFGNLGSELSYSIPVYGKEWLISQF